MKQTGRHWKEYLREEYPPIHRLLVKVYERASAEYRVLRHMHLRELWGGFLNDERAWKRLLPLQEVTRCALPASVVRPDGDLRGAMAEAGISLSEGGHAFYLSPESWRMSPLRDFAAGYPGDAGLKVMRHPGGFRDGAYAQGSQHSKIHLSLLYGHPHLLLVANAMARAGVGPKVYDVVELAVGAQVWVAYVVRHVAVRMPSSVECHAGVARLRECVRTNELSLIVPDGFNHPDFECPSCGGNAWIDDHGRFQFVDFQNFRLPKYAGQLRRIARAAAEASHFGDRSLLRGGAYLYQSVPGLGLPAKRDISFRIGVMSRLLREADSGVKDRMVLDVGCNLGMMIGQYLRLGARWCHGWDVERIVPHTDRLLSALGCTRYTLTGGMIQPDQDLFGNVPEFARAGLQGCVVSYLAIRGHVGWLNALASVPWSTMIYEGHEGESEAATRDHLEELRVRTGGTIGALASYRDGDSDPRVLAIIRRG